MCCALHNITGLAQAAKDGGTFDYTVKALSGLNHLFQPAQTGSPLEYATIETTFSPVALKVMGDWIIAHTR
jgi:hypothetical protein